VPKRVFDIVVAGLGLLITAPLFLAIGILIKRDSPGPVFFRQVRVGKKRRPFAMWKFRKMPHEMPEQGPLLTARNDRRLTRIGRWLERTKLDELPQLLNVLASEMSIVGPRPEVPRFVDRATPELWDQVLSVKPGIFGPNQVRYRNEADLYPKDCADVEAYYLRHILPAKLEVDARYARRSNPVTDVWLLVRGVLAAAFGLGSQ
jgi:lipopolysaccharide/colanic/teichoic acid biosynthesis glycosyltransferase